MSAVRVVAGARILLGVAVATNALEIAAVMLRVESGRLAMPSLLGMVPVTDATVAIWTLATMSAGFLMVCGAMTRAATLGAGVLCTFAILWDQQNYSHHLWLTTLLLVILSYARPDAIWSVRSAILRRRPREPHRLALLLMATQISVCYIFGALSKVNPWWLAGDELQAHMRPDLPEQLYSPLAVLVILTELFIGLGMWFRLTRLAALATGVVLHLSIVVLMIDPFPLVTFAFACLAVYPIVWLAPTVPALRAELRGPGTRHPAPEPLEAPASH